MTSTESCKRESESNPDTIRQYKVAKTEYPHVHQIYEPSASIPLYTAYTPNSKTKDHKYDLVIYSGCSNLDAIIGAARLSAITNKIKLAFGDPEGPYPIWEDMKRKPFTGKNQYGLCVELPSGERRLFEWKSTHDVHNFSDNPFSFARKIDGFSYRVDHRHLKLVDLKSGDIVARFIHCPMIWPGKMGDVEIKRDFGGRDWDRIVILSSLAIQAAQ
jgi:hypothetical protein